jgi:hypothetical protein
LLLLASLPSFTSGLLRAFDINRAGDSKRLKTTVSSLTVSFTCTLSTDGAGALLGVVGRTRNGAVIKCTTGSLWSLLFALDATWMSTAAVNAIPRSLVGVRRAADFRRMLNGCSNGLQSGPSVSPHGFSAMLASGTLSGRDGSTAFSIVSMDGRRDSNLRCGVVAMFVGMFGMISLTGAGFTDTFSLVSVCFPRCSVNGVTGGRVALDFGGRTDMAEEVVDNNGCGLVFAVLPTDIIVVFAGSDFTPFAVLCVGCVVFCDFTLVRSDERALLSTGVVADGCFARIDRLLAMPRAGVLG